MDLFDQQRIAHFSTLGLLTFALFVPLAGRARDQSPKYEVSAKGLAIRLSADGEIVGAKINANDENLSGETKLGGCVQVGETKSKKHFLSGEVEFTRTLRQTASGRTVTVTDRFKSAGGSIRWEIEIVSAGESWTTEIATELNYPVTAATRFWTAWSDPEQRNDGWRDPQTLLPFADRKWDYSNLSYSTPVHGDYISIPLATMAEPDTDSGVSLVLSPEDHILTMRLETKRNGEISFIRSKYRLGGGKPVRFAMDLVAHEADWRGGLRWMTERYPDFFNPPNPKADAMAGCGAYSGDENPIDVAKFKKMAFRVNWKLSDDYPWMGMFIPPVTNADETWERSCQEPAPPGKGRITSCRQMNDYARWMKTNGFFVLDYFNVTELGRNMDDPVGTPPARPDELWKSPILFQREKLPNAVWDPKIQTFYGARVTDCGDPDYQKFILEQADRDLRLLPDSAGICIDRMDWLRSYNPKADDGVSWVNGKPARSLTESWKSLMAQLGPKMHRAGKVIFCNPMDMRIDLMRGIDGIYSEHGETGPGLNSIALVAMRKPAITWTCMWWTPETEVWDLKPDPDSFFQRHLLMGVYPTAPYPFNNHALRPHPETDKQYIAYGPLMDAMRGKKWVLAPHCVETTTPGVKVNLFEVPGGYALPVTFGGKAKFADVVVRNIAGLKAVKCSALHPGDEAAVHPAAIFSDGKLTMHVPLHRGCAMVLLRK